MKLTNTVVTITVTIPEIEVDKELGLLSGRTRVKFIALEQLENDVKAMSYCKIVDAPDYPALCD